MASKQLATISGAVEAINDKGIKVLGDWLNFSQYHPISTKPTPGELVEVQVEQADRGQWINSLRIIGGTAPAGPVSVSTDQRSAEIRRQVAMKAAATLVAAAITTHAEAKIGMVFQVADQIDRWLEHA